MTLITSTAELQTLCAALKGETYITVDTEFLRDKTYYPKLCLIQVASQHTDFAVDPLAEGMDMTALFEVFADTNIVKVFHSARQDIEIILKLSGKVPVPLFDTQVAAMVCGFGASASYASLVADLVGKTVDKSSRFTDWSRRPLSDKQLDYALSDVTHLRVVYDKLKAKLEKTGRSAWLNEEMSDLTDPSNYEVVPEDAWMKLKPKGASRRFLGILRELAQWRELTAQKLDRPKTHVIKDQVLLEIAAVAPKDREGLRVIRGLGNMKKELEEQMLDVIAIALDLPESALPERVKPNKSHNTNEAVIEMLKVLLKAKCAEFHVAEKLVATSEELHSIEKCDTIEGRVAQGWRYEVFGQHAIALKKGEIGLAVKDGKVTITACR